MKSTFKLGYILPRLMLVLFLADMALRLMPTDWFAFRAFEALFRRYPTVDGPFQPNRHYVNDGAYGDLAGMGNLPSLREVRHEDLWTDQSGFHNVPANPVPRYSGMVVGDSFAISSEVPASETFSSRLSQYCGGYYYNAGDHQPLRLGHILDTANRIGLRRGTVIFEMVERNGIGPPPDHTIEGAHGWHGRLIETIGPKRFQQILIPMAPLGASPLQAVSRGIERAVQNGTFLPNTFSANVVVRELTNNDRLIFAHDELTQFPDPERSAREWLSYFQWLDEQLRADDLHLAVVLVPNKYSTYRPFFTHAAPPTNSGRFMSELTAGLVHAGLPVVNLEATFHAAAEAAVAKHQYLYWRDDTHWNAGGMQLGAAEVCQRLSTSPVPEKAAAIDGGR